MSLNNGKMFTELILLQLVSFQKEGYHRFMDLLLWAKSSSESLGILVCEQKYAGLYFKASQQLALGGKFLAMLRLKAGLPRQADVVRGAAGMLLLWSSEYAVRFQIPVCRLAVLTPVLLSQHWWQFRYLGIKKNLESFCKASPESLFAEIRNGTRQHV